MRIINLTNQNIEGQHICCGFSDKKISEGYAAKKRWLKTQFKNGYTFRKLDARGKVFIEYVPIEHSWLPLQGKDYMVINCFWVSGKFKGQGYGKKLLDQCKDDASRMAGIVAISSDKKRPFMSDPKFFKLQGFDVVDEAPPYFKLWAYKIKPDAPIPKIMDSARSGRCANKKGITVFYSDSCPLADYYTNNVLKSFGKKRKIPITIHHMDSQDDGHAMPVPWIISSIFYKGKLLSTQILSEKQLDKLIPAT